MASKIIGSLVGGIGGFILGMGGMAWPECSGLRNGSVLGGPQRERLSPMF